MFLALKIIHFLSFSVGIGGGVAAGILGARLRNAEASTQVAMGPVQKRIGQLSFVGLVLLWVTGVLMFLMKYGVGGLWNMDSFFWWKIAAAVILTLCSLRLQTLAYNAAKAGKAPPPKRMAMFGMLATMSAVVALALAVIAFSG